MNILEALSQQKPKNDDLRHEMSNGLPCISLGVFEATMYRMGFNPVEFDDVLPEQREFVLSYYETVIN